jgi:hypothetical protein
MIRGEYNGVLGRRGRRGLGRRLGRSEVPGSLIGGLGSAGSPGSLGLDGGFAYIGSTGPMRGCVRRSTDEQLGVTIFCNREHSFSLQHWLF